jgi:hypothetical protein
VLVTPTRLLVTGPVDGPHRVVLIDLGTGAVLDETIVEVVDAGMSATPHPTDGSAQTAAVVDPSLRPTTRDRLTSPATVSWPTPRRNAKRQNAVTHGIPTRA